MSVGVVLEKLGENPTPLSIETVKILLRISDNILKNSNNPKLRKLQKTNPIISSKVLSVNGGLLCLEIMGFRDNGSSFVLPDDIDLSRIQEVRDVLSVWLESVEVSDTANKTLHDTTQQSGGPSKTSVSENRKEVKKEVIKPIVLPPFVQLYKNPFLHEVEKLFYEAQRYDDKDVQKRAKALIPLRAIEEKASKRLHSMQKQLKKGEIEDMNISIQEMLILELLHWFKEDFFVWVSSPDCDYCGGKTKFSKMSTDTHLYTTRVELHLCETCHQYTPFARYNDLNILLNTRKGRCGEWANTFTLFCRSMGWDARFVVDQTDHVWTEVYSISQRRWLHCDPCENILDRPLVYELGWKKKITYIMAYSGEEVQDVTWRYTSNHKAVLQERKLCTETELLDAMIELRRLRQATCSESRRNYLNRRLLSELIELMTERQPTSEDNQGRQSGDLLWRLSRRETENESVNNYIWSINVDENTTKVTIKYSASKNKYILEVNDAFSKEINEWSSGCHNHVNILRKEEKDWKQVYLARQDGKTSGFMTWKFQIKKEKKKLESIEVHFSVTTFETGKVSTVLTSGDISEKISTGGQPFVFKNFAGKTDISLETELTGGKGDASWQHAQLFRQSLSGDEYPFNITFIFI